MLAQHVLHGKTKGYKHHPQLQRFYGCKNPKQAIAAYLSAVQKEATGRGYHFDAQKIMAKPKPLKIKVTKGQVAFELEHLKKKLRTRDPKQLMTIAKLPVKPHPLFVVVNGGIED